jgi:predicted branched-subunit amino acid permease
VLLSQLIRRPECREGARDMLSVGLGVGAWGLVTGVAMVKAGLPVSWALAMNLLVFAGSAQLAALPLLAAAAPIGVIWATCACVNLRFVVFSVQWRPFFVRYPLPARLGLGYISGDLTYALFMRRFGASPPAPDAPPEQAHPHMAYFLGASGVNWLCWQIPSIAGILAAQSIPTHWNLGFAGVLALLGVALSLMTDVRSALAAAMAGAAAVATYALPLRLNIVVAIAAAGVSAWLMEQAAQQIAQRRRVQCDEPQVKTWPE